MTRLDDIDEAELRATDAYRLRVAGMDPEAWCETRGHMLTERGECRVCGYVRPEEEDDHG